MGLYIKGMEMPKAQFQKISTLYHVEGTIFVYPDGKARAELSVDYKERKSYPLVPVPPHGRLGDLDELYASLKKWLIQNRHSMTEATRVWIRGVLEGIAAAPTIIQASKGG